MPAMVARWKSCRKARWPTTAPTGGKICAGSVISTSVKIDVPLAEARCPKPAQSSISFTPGAPLGTTAMAREPSARATETVT
jgi:hypothetical protein